MAKKSFSDRVYNIVKKIPSGKVSTYGNIAKALNTKAYRAVGSAMNKNPYAFSLTQSKGGLGGLGSVSEKNKVPCHRVINSNGNLGGFATGLKNKIKLLKSERIEIKNNKIDLKKYEYRL